MLRGIKIPFISYRRYSKLQIPDAVLNEYPVDIEKGFDQFRLAPALLKAIQNRNWAKPRLVQMNAIPTILCNRNVAVSAEAGTGKTAAYLIPIIQTLWTMREKGTLRTSCISK
jgi:superfamily II DNA/RNA helicase